MKPYCSNERTHFSELRNFVYVLLCFGEVQILMFICLFSYPKPVLCHLEGGGGGGMYCISLLEHSRMLQN